MEFKLISSILEYIKGKEKIKPDEISDVKPDDVKPNEISDVKSDEILCKCGKITNSYATDMNYNKKCLECYNKEIDHGSTI